MFGWVHPPWQFLFKYQISSLGVSISCLLKHCRPTQTHNHAWTSTLNTICFSFTTKPFIHCVFISTNSHWTQHQHSPQPGHSLLFTYSLVGVGHVGLDGDVQFNVTHWQGWQECDDDRLDCTIRLKAHLTKAIPKQYWLVWHCREKILEIFSDVSASTITVQAKGKHYEFCCLKNWHQECSILFCHAKCKVSHLIWCCCHNFDLGIYSMKGKTQPITEKFQFHCPSSGCYCLVKLKHEFILGPCSRKEY